MPTLELDRILRGAMVSLAAALALFGHAGAGRRPGTEPARVFAAAQARMPMRFETNSGQADSSVKFLARGPGFAVFLMPAGATVVLPGSRHVSGAVLRLKLAGCNSDTTLSGVEELPGRTNYFLGARPGAWTTAVPAFARVRYANVYPGIDLVFYGRSTELEYDFVVHAGADPARIAMEIDGADRVGVDREGRVAAETAAGIVLLRRPVVYQEVSGRRREIAARYALRGSRIEFALGAYDRERTIVIDPVLEYGTYLGGTAKDGGLAVALDALGNAYVAGVTVSPDFPVRNAPQAFFGGGISDVFVAKLDATGTSVVYATFLGGSDDDGGGADDGRGGRVTPVVRIAVDAEGNAWVASLTNSRDFPMKEPLQSVYGGGPDDAFVAKLDAEGALAFSTYLGGSGRDEAHDVAVDALGRAWLTGITNSADFPLRNALQPVYGGDYTDAFVARIAADGSSLELSSYLGGRGADVGDRIAASRAGEACVTGYTASPDFPTASAVQPALRGGFDAFVAKVSPDGSKLVYSTFLGGSGSDYVDRDGSVAVDTDGSVYLAGYTDSTDFPTMRPLQHANAGSFDVFVAQLDPAGTITFATYLGGSAADYPGGIALDGAGRIHVAGKTASADFPLRAPFQSALAGGFDSFLARIDPAASVLLFSTLLGGGDQDYAQGLAVSSVGEAVMTGFTYSSDFPVSGGALQPRLLGVEDCFVAKIDTASEPSLRVTMSKLAYRDGDTITASALRLKNPGAAARVRLQLWLAVPAIGEVPIIDIGADGAFVLPAGLDANLGSLALVPIAVGAPRGSWELDSRVRDAGTGAVLSKDVHPFMVR
jgi:hypothetical protein